MENTQLVQEFQTLERDISLFLPQMPKGQVVTLGSLKAQVISKFCVDAEKKIDQSKKSVLKESLSDAWDWIDDEPGRIIWCMLTGFIWLASLIVLIALKFSGKPLSICFIVSLILFFQNPMVWGTIAHIPGHFLSNRKLKNGIFEERDESLTKLESNRAFMTKSIRDYLGEVVTSFNNDYIKLDAKYRMIASKPRERVEGIVTRLDNQKRKIDQLKERVMSSEAKEFAKEQIDKSILRHRKFIQDLAPKEARLLQAAERVGEALVELRQTVNDLDLEAVEADYQAYEDSMDELGMLDQELIELRREHSKNIDFLNIELNALGRSIEGFRKSIQNYRSLIPTLSVAELPEAPTNPKFLVTSV